jgi:hypothetical protein
MPWRSTRSRAHEGHRSPRRAPAGQRQRLLRALRAFGFSAADLAVDNFTAPGQVVQLGCAPNRVDIMTAIDGVSFAEAWTGR